VNNTAIRCLRLPPARHLVLWLGIHLAMAFMFGNYLYASDLGDYKGFPLRQNNRIVSSDLSAKNFQKHDFGNFWKKNRIYGKRYSNDILRGVKLSDVYTFNDTYTTFLPGLGPLPAYANIWLEQSNFLACQPPRGRAFSYALCYYSGPDQPTGNSLSDNPSLPCKLSPDGVVANCTCYEISTDVYSPMIPYFVDIHAISNLDIYQKTVETCGQDGLKCAESDRVPPVCEAINTNLLVPGADAISVFSPIDALHYLTVEDVNGDNSTLCDGLYAGCMTAPCYRTGEKDSQGRNLMECKCPVYDGAFQIGQANQNCDANEPPPSTAALHSKKRVPKGNVWSAAYNPNGGPIKLPDGACVPDLPGSSGCGLYDKDKDYSKIDPDGALCEKVCSFYGNSTVNGDELQIGYTCDATLCTTLGIGQGFIFNPKPIDQIELLNNACPGIQDMDGMSQILLVEALAECSCCASQVCGCSNINEPTNQAVYELNQQQRDAGIEPQCDIPSNGTLCGSEEL